MKWHLVLWCAALLLPSNALGVESEGASWWRSLSSTGSFRIALGPEGNLRTTDGQCVSSAGEPCTAFSQPKPREDNGHFQVSDIHIAPSGEIWSEERSGEAQVLVSRFSREGAPEWTLVLPPAAELSSAVVSGSRVCLAMRLVGGPYDFSISGPAVMVGHRSVNGSSTPLVGCVEEQALRSVSLKR